MMHGLIFFVLVDKNVECLNTSVLSSLRVALRNEIRQYVSTSIHLYSQIYMFDKKQK